MSNLKSILKIGVPLLVAGSFIALTVAAIISPGTLIIASAIGAGIVTLAIVLPFVAIVSIGTLIIAFAIVIGSIILAIAFPIVAIIAPGAIIVAPAIGVGSVILAVVIVVYFRKNRSPG